MKTMRKMWINAEQFIAYEEVRTSEATGIAKYFGCVIILEF